MSGAVPGFEWFPTGRIRFGPGVRNGLEEAVRACGRRALLVRGRDAGRATWAREILSRTGMLAAEAAVPAEPDVACVAGLAGTVREADVDVVVGVGGGSVLDAAKAAAGLARQPGPVLRYLEGVGEGRPLSEDVLPVVAVPTTAGTGSEVTRNAVLTVPERRVKVSLRSPRLVPAWALVDPELTWGLPADVTAWSGMDALTQVIEPFVSCRANPLTDGLCREALVRAAWALPRVLADGGDREAREALCLVSLLGGLALTQAGLGAVHGIAGPAGGLLGAPHGALCAALLAPVMEANLGESAAQSDGARLRARYDAVARWLTGDAGASAGAGVAWVRDLARRAGIPRLAHWGLGDAERDALAGAAMVASSMRGNPVPLGRAAVDRILAAS